MKNGRGIFYGILGIVDSSYTAPAVAALVEDLPIIAWEISETRMKQVGMFGAKNTEAYAGKFVKAVDYPR